MKDLTFAMMTVGLEVSAVGLFVWASIDYDRFIKFWMIRPAPYTKLVKVAFRLFFLACVIGGLWDVVDKVGAFRQQPFSFYLCALLFA